MGKPISDNGVLPFGEDGILVNGANCNGNTFVKNINIYAQRSSDLYDLIDDDGNIYEFIRLVYRNTDGFILDYYELDAELVQSIPENTFYIKEQDPRRGIYGFSTLYHLHKIKIHDGNYIFTKTDHEHDFSLLGIQISPLTTTVKTGQTIDFTLSTIPITYENLQGSWDFSDPSLIETFYMSSDCLRLRIKIGKKVGKLRVSFTPENNDTITVHGYVNIIDKPVPLQSVNAVIKSKMQYPAYAKGEEFEVYLYPNPSNASLPSPEYVLFEEEYLEHISTSSDNRTYRFKVISDEGAKKFDRNMWNNKKITPSVRFKGTDDTLLYAKPNDVYVVLKDFVQSMNIKLSTLGHANARINSIEPVVATYDEVYYKLDPNIPDPVLSVKTAGYIEEAKNGYIEKTGKFTGSYHTPTINGAWRELQCTYNGITTRNIIWLSPENGPEYFKLKPNLNLDIKPGDSLQLGIIEVMEDGSEIENLDGTWMFDSNKDFYNRNGNITPTGLLTINDTIEKSTDFVPKFTAKYDAMNSSKEFAPCIRVFSEGTVVQSKKTYVSNTSNIYEEGTSFYENIYRDVTVVSNPQTRYEISDPEVLIDSTDRNAATLYAKSGLGAMIFTAGKPGVAVLKVWDESLPDVISYKTYYIYPKS